MRTRNRNAAALEVNSNKLADDITKELLKDSRIRRKLYRGRTYGIEIRVLTEEERHHRKKEVIEVKPVKRKLSKEEKKALHKKLAGSARLFSKEGVEESLRIANRDDWED
ncbi:hypothetical protein ACOI1C_12335 [Bacillus sp. DJP31]|uniref:hypothetical protein n=1 Tax=Bacillus sp. DJP31 TaxID=3409789 RepID=UPI003BB5AF0A